ncbi:MAG: hypothetical protein HY738_08365 [Bacteroidia bacterium]|nr:hypothetical protein [Bacteroidia bacterium]
MPFIRYENGDLASFTDKKCMCGVNQPLIKSIEGRTIDTITLADGAKVHGVFFTDILYELGFYADKISKFQVVQTIPGEIEFKLETVNLLNEKEQKLIESSVKPFFNKVYFNYLDKIELEKNGKFLYIKNRINN